ncbi:cupin domain-containing protein [Actinomycetospora endophytica]|uniref:Cupin domain-containing protein n=1 Tax=Actinomycetospora endophytica TaxID=2291215 RepID=A0ABS8PIH4_9PSEU|nr:cupin domain-containing protein [Actinomycetospora endophytica]MCD2198055.1 cupin domain-containing protein [Actinomycetospora endophytica]
MAQMQSAVDAGDLWWFLDSLIAIRADKSQTGGKLAVSENWTPRGGGSPLHTHSQEDETFLVLDGELHFWLGDETFQQGTGGLAFLPRSRQHAFSVTSETAHFMVIMTPGGFEDFYRTGRRATEPTFPPGPATQEDFKRAMDMAVSLGTSIDGPPPTP